MESHIAYADACERDALDAERDDDPQLLQQRAHLWRQVDLCACEIR